MKKDTQKGGEVDSRGSRRAPRDGPARGLPKATEKDSADDHRPPLQEGPVARRATATTEGATETAPGAKRKRTHSEVMRDYWADVHAGRRPVPQPKELPPVTPGNPLFGLPEKARGQLLLWLRECPFQDAIQEFLKEQGLTGITRGQLDEFFQLEAELHWEQRITRAALEADALVRLVERSPAKFSAGILAALGQEAFRQVASGQVDPDAMGKLATLFLRARSDERAEQMQELKREKLRHELQDQVEHALEKLAEEVERHPEARKAFEALRRELTAEETS
ncbi:MAG: hypothetical protein WDO13_09615 [Verrucomicrobiota bacterium]